MHQYLLISSLGGLWLSVPPLRLVGVLQWKIDHRNVVCIMNNTFVIMNNNYNSIHLSKETGWVGSFEHITY